MSYNILIISGSLSTNSHTRQLAEKVGERVAEGGAEPSLWHLSESPLPLCDPAFHWDIDSYPDCRVGAFVERVRSADGIVLASPLYHGSYSGVLKNALDLLWMDAFSNKPVGLVSHGASVRLCSRPIDALRPVVQAMYGYVAQTTVATCKADYAMSPSGEIALVDEGILQRVDRLALEMAALCEALGPQIPKEDDGTTK